MDTEVGSEPSRSHRREGTIVALCLFGLLLIGTALEFSRERLSVAALTDPDAPRSTAPRALRRSPVQS